MAMEAVPLTGQTVTDFLLPSFGPLNAVIICDLSNKDESTSSYSHLSASQITHKICKHS